MKKSIPVSLVSLILLSFVATLPFSVFAAESHANLMVIEWYGRGKGGVVTLYAISPIDDSMTNPHYKLLRYHWYTTIEYWINPKNKYGFNVSAVVAVITTSAETWDAETSFEVFAYKDTTSRSAGRYDGYNVISWGSYRSGVIAVTYIWYTGDKIIETDTRMNTLFKWSLSGEAGKMDVRNIMTHEFGHWCGLADLYDDVDYWLTMYGYSDYRETYKQTLGLGDINGLEAVYGP